MTPQQRLELMTAIMRFKRDPLGFCYYAFPWNEEGELADFSGPHQWQADILMTIGDHLQSEKWASPLRIAVSSGRGIGKSALIGMICQWAMSTCADCRVLVTANTETQLATKTWPEISKWFRRSINTTWWNHTATKICAADKLHSDTWRLDRETWSENNIEAFRGLHNIGKRMVIIFDEAAGIPKPLWEATQGSLTDENTEMIWIAFSNPSQPSGSFAECFGVFSHRWITKSIDSRHVPGTNKEEIAGWIQDYGEDHDYVRINVKGEFPRAGSNQLIGADVVSAARKRYIPPEQYEHHWKVLVCDPARFGDDRTVIGYRQGPKFVILDTLRGIDSEQVSRRLAMRIREHDPRTVVIDGDGLGGPIVDFVKAEMRQWFQANPARRLTEFHGGIPANDGFMYFNFRAEMWGRMRDWLAVGSIPDIPEIERDLCGPMYSHSGKNQITLERKEDMKKRGLASPDLGDTLAMSFCAIVAGKTQEERDRDKLAATGSVGERSLLQYKLTMEKEQRDRQAEERRPAHWE